MIKNLHKILVIGLLVSLLLTSVTVSTAINQNRTIYVDDDGGVDFTHVQDAINASSDGDTVFVYNGIYVENIMIDTSIDLVGESKEDTIIDGSGTGDVVYVSADGVSISGFTIQNSGSNSYWSDPDSGIKIKSSYNEVCDNIISSNMNGIHVEHSNNIIRNNVIQNNGHGVFVLRGGSTIIENNKICVNRGKDKYAIYLYETSTIDITKNNIIDNICGIYLLRSSKINITENHILSNDRALDVSEGSDLLISHNHIEDGAIKLDSCHAGIYQNNILGDTYTPVYLIGGETYWEIAHFIYIKKSENIWDNNYWGRKYLSLKFISSISITKWGITKISIYLDADLNPANRPFDIPD